MAVFVELARTLSLTEAGRNLGVSPSTLSRQLTTMERALGVPLLHRSTRRLRLTDAGERHLARCEGLAQQALRLHESVRAQEQALTGRLVVAAPSELGDVLLMPLLAAFATQHPALRLELVVGPATAATSGPAPAGPDGRPIDIALCLDPARQGAARARILGTFARGLYASTAYLARHPPLRDPGQLRLHSCILDLHAQDPGVWRLQRSGEEVGVEVGGGLESNDLSMRCAMVCADLGITELPERVAAAPLATGALVRVLPAWASGGLVLSVRVGDQVSPARAGLVLQWLERRFVSGVVT